MKMRALFALPLLVLTTTTAWAEENTTCRNGLFPKDPTFALAEVGGKDPAYFHDDKPGCPRLSTDCERTDYLVPGDMVIISKISRGLACTFYPGENGDTAGWIETSRLELPKIETNPPFEAWLGTWTSAGNRELTFTRQLGQLKVSGKTYWPARPGTTGLPSVREGAIGGDVDFAGHRGKYSASHSCEVKFTLLGDYLVASDNAKCGGANVSFSAVYRREAG